MRCRFLFERSDLFEMVTEKFDVIVSNPPYIPTDVIPQLMPEVQVFEPIEALDGKEDGLYFYRKIVEQSKDYLNSGGSLMFEIGYDQGKDVSKMMTDAGFSNVCVKKDLAGNDKGCDWDVVAASECRNIMKRKKKENANLFAI